MAEAIEEAVGIGQWVVAMETTAETAAQAVARVAFELWLDVWLVPMTGAPQGAVVMVVAEAGILVATADQYESITARVADWTNHPRWSRL